MQLALYASFLSKNEVFYYSYVDNALMFVYQIWAISINPMGRLET